MSMTNGAITEMTNTPAIIERANELVVCDPETYEAAATLKKQLKEQMALRVADFSPFYENAQEAYTKSKIARDGIKKQMELACEPYERAIAVVGNALNSYATELAEERRVAQAKADAAARVAAEKERQALLERAAAATKASTQESLLESAENVYVKPVIVPREIAKTIRTEAGNITQREGLEVIVVDIKLLCAEIGAGRVPITVIGEKQRELASWVKAMSVKVCPGLIIRPKTIVV